MDDVHESTEPRRCTVRPCGAGAARDARERRGRPSSGSPRCCAPSRRSARPRSRASSRFLVAIFSTETIVFGLAVVAGRAGAWPLDETFCRPNSLPLAVAIFSILVYRRGARAHGAADHAHRRPLFRQRRGRAGAHLAVPPLRRPRAAHRRRHGGVSRAAEPGRGRRAAAAQLLQPRLVQRHPESRRRDLLASAPVRVHALGVRLRLR